ncbi:MAG: hypothetical protein V3U34_00570 [candidate division NC10 bacterium]
MSPALENKLLRGMLQEVQVDNKLLAAKLKASIPRRRIREVLARHSITGHPWSPVMISELLAP